MINADSLQASTTGVIGAANDIFTLAKAVITGGGVIAAFLWLIKKFGAYLTEHHSNVTKHNTGREDALDKKEDMLFNSTAEERKQNFELLKSMLAESAAQTAAISRNAESTKDNATAIGKMVEVISSHSGLLQEHTAFISKLTEAIKFGNSELLNTVHNASENAFDKYVHTLQAHPEIMEKILRDRKNVITTVLAEVADTVELTDLTKTGASLELGPSSQPASS